MNEQSGQSKSAGYRPATGMRGSPTAYAQDEYTQGMPRTESFYPKDQGGASRYFPNLSSEESEQPLPQSSVESTILVGDCREVLAEMEAESVDALVTDPPAGISFMNKSWDSNKGSRNAWIAWLTEVMEEAYRVMKPGAHGLVWALPRTSHWTAMALEDAGFEIRDRVTHHFGSGFPKSLDVSKQLDKMAGAEREVVGQGTHGKGSYSQGMSKATGFRPYVAGLPSENNGGKHDLTAPSTAQAKEWAGWGTALKPSTEDWWLIRRPLSEKNVASQVLKTGTSALNIDACRVGTTKRTPGYREPETRMDTASEWNKSSLGLRREVDTTQGRWPPNLLMSHSPGCRPTGEIRRVKGAGWKEGDGGPRQNGTSLNAAHDGSLKRSDVSRKTFADPDGYEGVEEVLCVDSCPVRLMDEQGQKMGAHSARNKTQEVNHTTANKVYAGEWTPQANNPDYYGSDGGSNVSRFFPRFPSSLEPEAPFKYAAKASRRERNAGLEGMPEKPAHKLDGGDFRPEGRNLTSKGLTHQNVHPTVKPLALMRWLVRLVTPPNGVVLDPFAGSGTTLCAAVLEGFNAIGIEAESEYAEIARRRIAHWSNIPDSLEKPAAPSQKARNTYGFASTRKVPRCPEHNESHTTASTTYKCGCPFVYEKASEAPSQTPKTTLF